jgi:hypothetical protein
MLGLVHSENAPRSARAPPSCIRMRMAQDSGGTSDGTELKSPWSTFSARREIRNGSQAALRLAFDASRFECFRLFFPCVEEGCHSITNVPINGVCDQDIFALATGDSHYFLCGFRRLCCVTSLPSKGPRTRSSCIG